jgi:hypothetical protein
VFCEFSLCKLSILRLFFFFWSKRFVYLFVYLLLLLSQTICAHLKMFIENMIFIYNECNDIYVCMCGGGGGGYIYKKKVNYN